MKHQTKKENRATKVCLVCGLPFTWRKKWEKVWDEVKYCSDKCRMNKSSGIQKGNSLNKLSKGC